MSLRSLYIPSPRGHQLHLVIGPEIKSPKALVIYSHGYAGHAARYEAVVNAFANYDIQAVGIDLTGHGRSEGLKGYIADFSYWVDDFDVAIQYGRDQFPNIPVFLLGHSMGALVVTTTILDRKPNIRGALLSGIALHVTASVPDILVKISSVVSAILPKLPTTKLKVDLTAKNKASVERYISDPLIYHGGIRARTGYTFMKAAERALARLSEFDTPVILFHGKEDQLATPNGSTDMYADISSSDKVLRILDGLYHEVLNEDRGPSIIEEMANWILERSDYK